MLEVEFLKDGGIAVVQMFDVVDEHTFGLKLNVAAFPGYMRRKVEPERPLGRHPRVWAQTGVDLKSFKSLEARVGRIPEFRRARALVLLVRAGLTDPARTGIAHGCEVGGGDGDE